MSKTQVVNYNGAPTNWHLDEDYVYIGRGQGALNDPKACSPKDSGYLGNPFKLLPGEPRGNTIEKYREYFNERMQIDRDFCRTIISLLGKKLVCWCAPAPCHGHVIAEWLEANREVIEFNAQDAFDFS